MPKLGAAPFEILWRLRHNTEYNHILRTLDKISIERSECYDPDDNWLPSDIKIISGAARGADSGAIDWAVVNWCEFKEYPADWAKHGKSAGPIRNQQMLDEGKPDLVVAFPGWTGTADMVRRARKAGIEVIECDAELAKGPDVQSGAVPIPP